MIDDDELMDQSQVDNILRNLKQRNDATKNELTNCKVSISNLLKIIQIAPDCPMCHIICTGFSMFIKKKKYIYFVNYTVF